MNVRILALLAASLFAAAALAGCTNNDGGDGDIVPGDNQTQDNGNNTTDNGNATASGEYTLTTAGIPAILTAGNDFTFELMVNGSAGTSDHLGAHIADNTTAAPGPGRLDCVHDVEAAVPGAFHISCSIPSSGVWYVYGHMQTVENGQRVDHWAEPVEVTVYDYSLALAQSGIEGLSANFTLTITGSPESNTTHSGAHYSTEPVTGKFSTTQMGACQHPNESAPGEFAFTCEFPDAGTYYVYGHYRVQVERGGTWIEDFWSAAVQVTVEGGASS